MNPAAPFENEPPSVVCGVGWVALADDTGVANEARSKHHPRDSRGIRYRAAIGSALTGPLERWEVVVLVLLGLFLLGYIGAAGDSGSRLRRAQTAAAIVAIVVMYRFVRAFIQVDAR